DEPTTGRVVKDLGVVAANNSDAAALGAYPLDREALDDIVVTAGLDVDVGQVVVGLAGGGDVVDDHPRVGQEADRGRGGAAGPAVPIHADVGARADDHRVARHHGVGRLLQRLPRGRGRPVTGVAAGRRDVVGVAGGRVVHDYRGGVD